MFVVYLIKAMYYERQLYKFEKRASFCTRSIIKDLKNWFERTFETEEARVIRLAKEEAKREQLLKGSNERLALLLLSEGIGNEDKMNRACDLIKQMGLVEDYE